MRVDPIVESASVRRVGSTPIASARPHPDREPDRTHATTRCAGRRDCDGTPIVSKLVDKARIWYCISCAPNELLRDPPPRVGESPRALAGVMGGLKAVMGKAPDGQRTPPGAMHWSWCYGRQPVYVHNAVYAGSDEARHLVRGITENEAQRQILGAALDAVGGEIERLPPDQLAAYLAMQRPALARARLARRGAKRRTA